VPLAIAIFTYTFSFISVFFQVFLIITLLEHKEQNRKKDRELAKTSAANQNNEPLLDTEGRPIIDPAQQYPTVTILVPVFNEEKTVEKTIDSLLALEYPADRLSIMVVDDGSRDNTWNLIQKFTDHPQISLYQKENGGKYTALNHGIKHSTSEYIGCLDADSFVDSKALLHIIPYFEDPEIVAVTPSMKIQNPDTILGLVQNAEYNMGIFTRKIFTLLDAQYVTPGPFSIFKKSVFDRVGLYRHAHNTEDLEMALRLQEQHLRIANADKAIVYTVGPRTLYKLYKQRVRWTGGFIQNTLDYKKMIFNPRYGNLGFFVLPLAMYTIVGTLILLFHAIYTTSIQVFDFYEKTRLVGLQFSLEAWSWEKFVYGLRTPLFIGALIVCMVVFTIWYGKRMAGIRDKKMMDIVYFLLLYALIAPLWLVTSVWNTIRQRDASWR
jgi:cellulose synthase/poly-beta-1,6-N-acetylglucosamine synthase-like glycosyltransferase